MKSKFKIQDIFLRLMLFFWALTIICPLFWTLYVSLKTNKEFFKDAWALPKSLQWGNYVRAFFALEIGMSLLNTAYYVILSLVIGISITTLVAFALTRVKWKGRNFVWGLVMISLFLPGINALVPQYVLMCKFHLNNSLNGLVFLNSVGLHAFDLMLLGGFMRSIPKELEESAFIDGATILQMFRRVIVPLAVPGIITIAIFRFIGLYNDFIGPFIYLSDAKKHTIAVKMYYANLMMQYKSDWVGLFAGVTISMIPLIITYILLQKRIVQGATLGGVKG